MRIEFTLQPDDPSLDPLRDAWRRAGERHGGRHAALTQRARDHYASLIEQPLPSAVREPLALIPVVADLLDDSHWQADANAREQFAGALAYFVEPDDLIPDGSDRFGYLDDAFVIKLALAEARHEWFAWCDYRDYITAHPDDTGIDRATWMQRRRERLEASLRRRGDMAYGVDAARDAGYGAQARRDGGYGDARRYSPIVGTLARFGVR